MYGTEAGYYNEAIETPLDWIAAVSGIGTALPVLFNGSKEKTLGSAHL